MEQPLGDFFAITLQPSMNELFLKFDGDRFSNSAARNPLTEL
jgi:hypothetical protein